MVFHIENWLLKNNIPEMEAPLIIEFAKVTRKIIFALRFLKALMIP